VDASVSSPLAATMPTTRASSQSMLLSSMISESLIHGFRNQQNVPAKITTVMQIGETISLRQESQAILKYAVENGSRLLQLPIANKRLGREIALLRVIDRRQAAGVVRSDFRNSVLKFPDRFAEASVGSKHAARGQIWFRLSKSDRPIALRAPSEGPARGSTDEREKGSPPHHRDLNARI
jgi:hypothetical protein